MTAIKSRKLGSVISVSKGKKHLIAETPTSSSKRLLGIDDLRNDNLLRYTDDPSGTAVLPEDLLIAWDGANAGTIGFGKSGYIGSTIARLRVGEKEKIFTPFLGMFLKSKFNYLRQTSTGATIPHINRKALDDIELPNIDFNDQVCIAFLLGKVEGLIAQRKLHLQQFDDLLKSVFLEMFGECLKDEDNYQPILEACDFIDYRGKTPPRVDTGIPLISAKCVRRGYFDATRLDFVSEETYRSSMTRGYPKANDVLFTTEGATFGYTCRIPRDFQNFAVGQRLITLICKNGFQPEVLEFVLNYPHIQKKLNSRLSGSAVLGIRSAELAKVVIPSPHPDAQSQFSAIVKKVESIKPNYQKSLTDLETLYCALSQQAFKGELDLSRIDIPQLSPVETQSQVASPAEDIVLPEIIELPELPIELSLFGEKREAALQYWFASALNNLQKDSAFQTEKLIDAINFRLIVMDEQDREFDVADYEILKRWIFDALANGTLMQKFDSESNKTILKSRSADWGTF